MNSARLAAIRSHHWHSMKMWSDLGWAEIIATIRILWRRVLTRFLIVPRLSFVESPVEFLTFFPGQYLTHHRFVETAIAFTRARSSIAQWALRVILSIRHSSRQGIPRPQNTYCRIEGASPRLNFSEGIESEFFSEQIFADGSRP